MTLHAFMGHNGTFSNHDRTEENKLANLGSVLKEEIVRLARKEVRNETLGLKKASTQHRSDIAALKRRVASLERQVSALTKQAAANTAPPSSPDVVGRVRFTAKGFRAQRQRLGLSARGMGLLLGVSPQTIYNWEAENSRPRREQMTAIAALRGVGKREASARLIALSQ